MTFYRANQRLIAHGQPFRFGSSILSYRNPQGYQVCGFTDKETLDESGRLLLIVFGFNLSNSEDVDLRYRVTVHGSRHRWGKENWTAERQNKLARINSGKLLYS
ncbi:hypothetical protein [Enterococcus sp.]|uniref:hypothetical protein n=1 Tax=Enterococcus sp. TaxID=35783 RepID=UPI003995BAEA